MRKFVLILLAIFSLTSCYKEKRTSKYFNYGCFSDEWVIEQDSTYVKSITSSCVINGDSVNVNCIRKWVKITYKYALDSTNLKYPTYEKDTLLVSKLKTPRVHFFNILKTINGKEYYHLGNEVYITDKMINEIKQKYGTIQN